MNISTEKKLMALENRIVVAKGEGVGWTGSMGLIDAKLLHLEWISNEILLYSRATISSHLRWSMMENDMRRRRMSRCICDWVILLYSQKRTEY